MLNSVMGQGLQGMQHSQKQMLQSAQQVARAGQPGDDAVMPVSNTGLPSGGEQAGRPGSGDVVEPLVAIKRQEQIFNASAKIVSVADKTVGSLIDEFS